MIYIEGYKEGIELAKDKSLSEALKEKNIFHSVPCGGLGICGKCCVQVIKGSVPVSEADAKHLNKKQLGAGLRLACRIYGPIDASVRLLSLEDNIKVLVDEDISSDAFNTESCNEKMSDSGFAIAIDLGTTTLAAVLINDSNGKIIDNASSVNHQRAFGSDVISRIKAANEGSLKLLSDSIRNDLRELIVKLINTADGYKANVKQIAIAGNTTMISLLMGYSVAGLLKYPFTPYSTSSVRSNAKELFDIDREILVDILPSIAAFVGADIVSGLYALDFDRSDKIKVLIDLGTNGEMAIGNKDRILVTSTAAGPAFEAGNISCGASSVPGAIYDVDGKKGRLAFKTIDNKPMIGLCGSGLIALIRELLKRGDIDKEGRLSDTYLKSGYPLGRTLMGDRLSLTQSDVRELLLAKAAISSGFEILLKSYGATLKDVDAVYIAGGFGNGININYAVDIGLFMDECQDKLISIGNSSLKGCMRYLLQKREMDRLNRIVSISKEVVLSLDEDFNDAFIREIRF